MLGAFPGGSSDKEPTCQCRKHKRRKFDPWVGKIPCRRPGQGNPLQYSRLENPRDRGAWWAAAQGAAKSRTRLSAHPDTNTNRLQNATAAVTFRTDSPAQTKSFEKIRAPPVFHSNSVHSSQDTEANRCPSAAEWTRSAWSLRTTGYHSAGQQSAVTPLAATWTGLMTIKPREVRQTEEDKCCLISLIRGV